MTRERGDQDLDPTHAGKLCSISISILSEHTSEELVGSR
jgi:hypothetical protein